MKIVNMITRSKWIKELFKPLWRFYLFFTKKNRNRKYRKYGKDALQKFNKAIEQTGCKYCLAFGTLLGAVREKGFIKHDLDIDVFMWADEWSEEIVESLFNEGFKKTHTFLVDGGTKGREETYELNGVSIDIFYIYPAIDNYPYCCDFLAFPECHTFSASMKKHGGLIVRRVELPIERELVYASFEGLNLPVPSNYGKVLEYRYGPDYMIPNPNWSIDSYDNHIKVWEGQIGEYVDC